MKHAEPSHSSHAENRISIKKEEYGHISGTSKISKFPVSLVLPPPPRLATIFQTTAVALPTKPGLAPATSLLLTSTTSNNKRKNIARAFSEADKTVAPCASRYYSEHYQPSSNKKTRVVEAPLEVRPDEKLFIEAAVALSNISQDNGTYAAGAPRDEVVLTNEQKPPMALAAPAPLRLPGGGRRMM